MRAAGRSCAVLIGAVWLAAGSLPGCVAPQPKRAEVVTGSRAEVSEDGLHRLRNAGFKNAWAKPEADFGSYDKVILQLVKIRYKRKPRTTRTSSTRANFALSQSQLERMQRYFREIFEEELATSSGFELVSEPGPDVLFIGASIIDLVVSVPTESSAGREMVLTSSTGKMTLMLEVYDSESGEILARLAERREARSSAGAGHNDLYWSNSVTNSDSVRRLFKRWARILRERLDLVHRVEPGWSQ